MSKECFDYTSYNSLHIKTLYLNLHGTEVKKLSLHSNFLQPTRHKCLLKSVTTYYHTKFNQKPIRLHILSYSCAYESSLSSLTWSGGQLDLLNQTPPSKRKLIQFINPTLWASYNQFCHPWPNTHQSCWSWSLSHSLSSHVLVNRRSSSSTMASKAPTFISTGMLRSAPTACWSLRT